MSRLPLLFLLPALLFACTDGAIQTNNTPPEATILEPADGLSLIEGRMLAFRGSVDDSSTLSEELEVLWTSSVDGTLMEGTADEDGGTEFTSAELSPGTHTITLGVLDKGGASAEDSVTLEVTENLAPGIEIVSPLASGRYFRDVAVELVVDVGDPEDDAEQLRVSWLDGGSSLNEDLAPDSAGRSTVSRLLGEGEHELMATVTDSLGRTGSDSVTITVGPPNSRPECSIDSPPSGSAAELGTSVVFTGTTTDVDEGADRLAVTWESSIEGAMGSSTPSSEGGILHAHTFTGAGTHTITMQVTDTEGATCTANLLFSLSTAPTAQIDAPADQSAFNDSDAISFQGQAHDTEQPDDTLLISWNSNIDGVLDASAPDSGGSLAFNGSLSAGTHLVTLRVEDEHGLVTTDSVTLPINGAPSAPGVSITPASPTSTQPLTVSIDVPSVDPEGSPVTYTYIWSLGGAPQAAYSGLTGVPASATTSGDVWSVSVTASDGSASSAPGTASATIVGSPPSITGVTVSPSVALATATFTATPSGWFDADGDPPGYLYQWAVNGVIAPAGTAASFVPVGAAAGVPITVEVTPWDGGNAGSPLTGSASINTPPTVAGVTLGPGAAYEGTTLTASFSTTTDPDPQTVTVSWEWEVDGNPVAGVTANALTGADFDAGETVVAFAVPNDGLEDGVAVPSTGVLILNTLPGAPVVTIDPQAPGETDDLWCEVTTPSADVDFDPITYTMSWTVNGVAYNGATTDVWPGDTVPGSATLDTEVWECTAVPNDGSGPGTPGIDSVTIVGGTCSGGLAITVEGIGGNFEVCTTCTVGDYSCQAHQVCEGVTGGTCLFQTYDCATGTQGSWYPAGGTTGSGFNFAYAYDFWSGWAGYGNICDCNPDDSTQYGLYRGHTYCGTGHWFRQ